MSNIPKMPEEYKGQINKCGGFTTTQPRAWTDKELEWVKDMKAKGYSNKDIAESTDRSVTSVSIKVKRLGKKADTYNKEHVIEKYEYNHKFLEYIKPKSVLDLYCSEKSFYTGIVKSVTTNDKNEQIKADYHMCSLTCICLLYSQGNVYDVVDLDPFGSAYDCFDLAIKMARKGIVITLGEMGHKRWKRLDYVSRYYGIEHLEDFTIDRLIKHIQMIGKRNKKNLIPVYVKEWRNIGRVWFEIEPLKITEQWQGNIEEQEQEVQHG